MTRATVLILLTACFLGGAASAQSAATLVVAQLHPQANDDNPGTPDRPLRTIGAAAKLVKPGTTVLIDTGIYRESVSVETSGTAGSPIRFQALPMAKVVVTGADVLDGWRREEGAPNVFSAPWPHVFVGWTAHHAHPDDDYHLLIGRAEQVFADGYPLLGVAAREQLSRGTFFADEVGKRLYVRLRTDQAVGEKSPVVEASTRESVWLCKGSHVQTKGLCFRYAANMAQRGAYVTEGDYDVTEDCTIESMNGPGATFDGKGAIVRRCLIRSNGQLGFAAHGDDLLVTESVCENNNTKNFNRGWEAGGNKLVLCKRAVLDRCIFRDNWGVGVWFDIGNEDCEVRNCLIADNQDAGIFYEISYGLRAHDNVICGNGFLANPGAWGGNGGITLSSSPGAIIERNLLIGNKEGFQFREQGRTTPRFGDASGRQYAVWNHDSTIRNNVIAFNRDFQSAGWFDLPSGYHWPRALQAKALGKEPPAREAIPAGSDLTRLPTVPQGLALEDLNFQFATNLYAMRPGQALFRWGCFWHYHETYETLDQVRATLKFEQGSEVGKVEFLDAAARDLRVRPDSQMLRMKCYPQGSVPGVLLGIAK